MRVATILIILAAVLGGGIYDIVAAVNSSAGDTFTEVLRDLSFALTVAPFSAGYLMGHVFWPIRSRLAAWYWYLAFLGTAATLMGADLIWSFDGMWVIPVAFQWGFVSGHFLWGVAPRSQS